MGRQRIYNSTYQRDQQNKILCLCSICNTAKYGTSTQSARCFLYAVCHCCQEEKPIMKEEITKSLRVLLQRKIILSYGYCLGLGCDATSDEAVRKIYQTKAQGRK